MAVYIFLSNENAEIAGFLSFFEDIIIIFLVPPSLLFPLPLEMNS